MREHYMLSTLDDILPQIRDAKRFSVLDLREGYLHCELDYQSSLLTTMATPFGRLRWLRLPFGLNASAEIFQKGLHQFLEGLAATHCIANDILVLGSDNSDNHKNMRNLMKRASDTGMKFNETKIQDHVPEVKFVGHIVGQHGLKPDREKIRAIADMSKPTSVEEVERLKCMIGYLSRYVPHLSHVLRPISMLTRQDIAWTWDEMQDQSLAEVKELIRKAPALAYFDPKKQLCIQCDASGQDLGAALMQDGRSIAYHSRSRREAETRYSTMEKEMLALIWSLEKWHQFTYTPTTNRCNPSPKSFYVMRQAGCKACRFVLSSTILKCATWRARAWSSQTLSRAALAVSEVDGCNEFDTINAVDFIPMRKEHTDQVRDTPPRRTRSC